jgi:hypothetical protein
LELIYYRSDLKIMISHFIIKTVQMTDILALINDLTFLYHFNYKYIDNTHQIIQNIFIALTIHNI